MNRKGFGRGIACLLGLLALAFVSCEPNSGADAVDEPNAGATVAQPTSVGDGTAEAPYTVCQVLAGVHHTTDVYVCGYIVGFFNDNTINKAVLDNRWAVESNILLAPSPDETDIRHMLAVQLSKDKIRREVSLAYQPQGLRRAVVLKTEVVSQYCNAIGLRNIQAAQWIDEPSTLDFLYGHTLHLDQPEEPALPEEPTEPAQPEEPSDPEQPTQPEQPETPTDPEQPDTPSTPDAADDTFDMNGATGFLPVAGVNQNSGRDENYPCLPDFVIASEILMTAYKETGGWLIGYVAKWYNDTMFVLSSTPTMPTDNPSKKVIYVDLKNNDNMLEWMKRKYEDYGNTRMLRVKCNKLKKATGIHADPSGYHAQGVETLNWTDWRQ